MTELVSRIAAATPEMQRELILEAWREMNPEPVRNDWGRTEYQPNNWQVWFVNLQRLIAMLDIGAYESAVIGMVPEGWHWRIDQGRNAGGALFKIDGHEQIFEIAETPALALLAAILQAADQHTGRVP